MAYDRWIYKINILLQNRKLAANSYHPWQQKIRWKLIKKKAVNDDLKPRHFSISTLKVCRSHAKKSCLLQSSALEHKRRGEVLWAAPPDSWTLLQTMTLHSWMVWSCQKWWNPGWFQETDLIAWRHSLRAFRFLDLWTSTFFKTLQKSDVLKTRKNAFRLCWDHLRIHGSKHYFWVVLFLDYTVYIYIIWSQFHVYIYIYIKYYIMINGQKWKNLSSWMGGEYK